MKTRIMLILFMFSVFILSCGFIADTNKIKYIRETYNPDILYTDDWMGLYIFGTVESFQLIPAGNPNNGLGIDYFEIYGSLHSYPKNSYSINNFGRADIRNWNQSDINVSTLSYCYEIYNSNISLPNFDSVIYADDYIFTGTEESWVIQAWDVFKDYFSGKPFHWIKSLRDFWSNRFTDLRGFWDNLFHKDIDGNIQTDINIVSPTPLPPSPTPISYSTIVVFDSTTNSYIYKYEYTDNNNNTIIATAPPEQPSTGSGSGENIKDDYYPSNPLDVPRDNGMWSPQFTINLGNGESLDIDLNTMNDTLIQGADPYLDDIDASTDLFGAIPQDWFFLIGFCAIIPLICGIINRFLG